MSDDSQGGLRGDPVGRIGESEGTRDQMCKRISELEAARDHLRARLHQFIPYAQHKAGCESVSHRRSDDGGVTFAWPAKDCTCGLADLLAVLTECPQDEMHDDKNNEKNDLARVVTMGEGTDSRTASEDVAGRVEPTTPDQARHEP